MYFYQCNVNNMLIHDMFFHPSLSELNVACCARCTAFHPSRQVCSRHARAPSRLPSTISHPPISLPTQLRSRLIISPTGTLKMPAKRSSRLPSQRNSSAGNGSRSRRVSTRSDSIATAVPNRQPMQTRRGPFLDSTSIRSTFEVVGNKTSQTMTTTRLTKS